MVARRRGNPARGTTTQQAIFSRYILSRDNYECQIRIPGVCVGVARSVDHIVPVSQAPWLALDPDNGRAACRPCNRAKGVLPDSYLPREFPASRNW